MRSVLISILTLTLCLSAQGACAGLITLDPTTTGSIRQQETCGRPGCFALQYSSTNPLNDLGFWFIYNIGSSTVNSSVGYLLFDLSGMIETAYSATLELDLRYATNANPGLKIGALDATIAADLSSNPVGTQYGAIDLSTSPITIPALYSQLAGQYFAISSGTELGMLSQSGPLDGLYSVSLSNSALDSINATSGLFGLGLTWTANTGNQFPNGADLLSFNGPPRLVLGHTDVPLP
ncbi:MAG: hypothetical protein R3E64_17175 [Halioglobus sp.]